MGSRQAFGILRRNWWLLVLGAVVGGMAAAMLSLVLPSRYTATTQLFVSTTDTASTADIYQGGQFSQQRVRSYAELLTGEELAARVAQDVGIQTPVEELTEQVKAVVVPETVLIQVDVDAASPEQAQTIAESIGEQFPLLVEELETPNGGAASPVKVAVAERPEKPLERSSPRLGVNVALGLVAGLFSGTGVAVLGAVRDRSVRDPRDVAELVGAPVIGTVLRDQGLEKRHTMDRSGANRTAEDYRQLRNNLQFVDVDNPPKIIMISSALPSEGKTTAVVNLALALVDAGRKVTIIEADLRKPKVTRYLGIVGGVGLTNLLAGTADLEDVVQRYGEDGLQVIAAGPTPPNPGELLASTHMADLLEKLRASNDFVILDVPPLLPVADSSGLAVHTDGVLLSVRYGSTRRDQLQQAAATLNRVGARTLGVILNIVPPKAEVATAYGYGYGYGYGVDGKHAS